MIKTILICDCCEATRTAEKSDLSELKRTGITGLWTNALVAGEGTTTLLCPACSLALGYLAECPGETHAVIRSGGDVDHCQVCAPHWGLVRSTPQPVAVTRQEIYQAYRLVMAKRRPLAPIHHTEP